MHHATLSTINRRQRREHTVGRPNEYILRLEIEMGDPNCVRMPEGGKALRGIARGLRLAEPASRPAIRLIRRVRQQLYAVEEVEHQHSARAFKDMGVELRHQPARRRSQLHQPLVRLDLTSHVIWGRQLALLTSLFPNGNELYGHATHGGYAKMRVRVLPACPDLAEATSAT